jgi:ATP-dependent helicase/nuclease subunit B
LRAKLELHASDLLARPSVRPLIDPPPVDTVAAVGLPGGHPEWVVPSDHLSPSNAFSATSLDALLGCPLRWALQYRAGIRKGGDALPPIFLLSGKLGHRLIELLHAGSAFDLDDASLESRALDRLDELIEREGALLLRNGMGLERSQLKSQLVSSVLTLARTLRNAGLRIVAIEKRIDVEWRGGKLEGSIDLLVATGEGVHGIIDVKTGISRYRKLIQSGLALQLAAYAFAHATEQGERELPEAAYFSLKKSRLLGPTSRLWPAAESIDGPSLDETWRKVERSVDLAERTIAQGRFPVAGVRQALPLLDALGVEENDRGRHLAFSPEHACEHCDYDALCGRRWEVSA